MTAAKKQERPKFSSIHDEIQWHKDNGSNILIPMTKVEESELFKPVIDETTLSIEAKDAYHMGQGKYVITLQGKNKLNVCAGTQWDPNHTRRTDDGKEPLYISFQARGGVKKSDGSMMWHTGHYDLDLSIIREEIEAGHKKSAYSDDAPGWLQKKNDQQKKEYIQWATDRDWLKKRRHKFALCESGAKSRVTISLLGLKNTYAKEELSRPFVVVRYILRPNDPILKQMLLMQSMNAIAGIYGPPQQQMQQLPLSTSDDFIEAEAADIDVDNDLDQPLTDTAAPFTPMDPDTWDAATKGERIAELTRLADHVKYDLAEYIKRGGGDAKKIPDDQLYKLFNHLCGMVKPAEDDIPF